MDAASGVLVIGVIVGCGYEFCDVMMSGLEENVVCELGWNTWKKESAAMETLVDG